jgi:hypothetical protein
MNSTVSLDGWNLHTRWALAGMAYTCPLSAKFPPWYSQLVSPHSFRTDSPNEDTWWVAGLILRIDGALEGNATQHPSGYASRLVVMLDGGTVTPRSHLNLPSYLGPTMSTAPDSTSIRNTRNAPPGTPYTYLPHGDAIPPRYLSDPCIGCCHGILLGIVVVVVVFSSSSVRCSKYASHSTTGPRDGSIVVAASTAPGGVDAPFLASLSMLSSRRNRTPRTSASCSSRS